MDPRKLHAGSQAQRVLQALVEGPLRMPAIARRAGLLDRRAGFIIVRLRYQGRVERANPEERNLRAIYWRITDDGRLALATVGQAALPYSREYAAQLARAKRHRPTRSVAVDYDALREQHVELQRRMGVPDELIGAAL